LQQLKINRKPKTSVSNTQEKIAEIKQLDREIHAFVEYTNESGSYANNAVRGELVEPLAKPVQSVDIAETLQQAQGERGTNKYTNSPIDGQFEANMPEGALHNWTFAIKSNIAVAGLAHSAGIAGYAERIAEHDAFCVSLLRQAGATIIGTVNMEEAALGATTNNPHFGKTHNPHRIGFTPGGSSGGSGAAVAAGMVRAALGSDTMGSCRLPAAYCGVVGFKPSFGRVSCDGLESLSRRLDHVGLLASTVDDVASIFAVLDHFDQRHADARQYPTLNPKSLSLPVIAVLDDASRMGLTNEVNDAYAAVIEKLQTAGWRIVKRAVDQTTLAAARRAGLLICEAELANSLGNLIAKNPAGLSAHLHSMIAFGATKSAPTLALAHAAIDDAALVLRAQFDEVDAVVWPTAPQQAFSFDVVTPANQADFTCLANFTGAPAISLPIPVRADALPIGLQIMMPRGQDTALLAMAAAIERIIG
jgi:aspartyl-tRNA(Asn)/glutamyl-tRNA(Gln) amidotransferase subunit A